MSEIAIAVINAILPVVLQILGIGSATKQQTAVIQAITQAIQAQQTVENTNILGLQNQLTAVQGQLTTLQATVATGNLQTLSDLHQLLTVTQLPGPVVSVPTSGDNANAVWDFVPPGQDREAYQLLTDAGWEAINTGTSFVRKPLPTSVYLDLVTEWQFPNADLQGADGPGTDVTDIRPGDDLLSWLNRTTNANAGANAPYTWTYGGPFGPDVAFTVWIDVLSAPESWLVCNISAKEFELLKASGSSGGVTGTYWLPKWGNGYIVAEGPFVAGVPTSPPTAQPVISPDTILPADTLGDWVSRALGGVVFDSGSGTWYYIDPSFPPWVFRCVITDPVFDYFQHYLYTPSSGPPERSTLGDLNTILATIPFQFP